MKKNQYSLAIFQNGKGIPIHSWLVVNINCFNMSKTLCKGFLFHKNEVSSLSKRLACKNCMQHLMHLQSSAMKISLLMSKKSFDGCPSPIVRALTMVWFAKTPYHPTSTSRVWILTNKISLLWWLDLRCITIRPNIVSFWHKSINK